MNRKRIKILSASFLAAQNERMTKSRNRAKRLHRQIHRNRAKLIRGDNIAAFGHIHSDVDRLQFHLPISIPKTLRPMRIHQKSKHRVLEPKLTTVNFWIVIHDRRVGIVERKFKRHLIVGVPVHPVANDNPVVFDIKPALARRK